MIWRYNDRIFQVKITLRKVGSQNWCSLQVINRNIKEALQLWCMEVNRNQAVNLIHLQQVGNQLGRDRFPTAGFSILTSIAIVRHDHVDFCRTSPPQGIDHDQKLHQIGVNRLRNGLQNIYFATTNAFVDGNRDFAIRKVRNRSIRQRQS